VILPWLTISTKIRNVTDTYFQHKVLTRLHGQPTYETLQTLATEIKANAASVPSTLGGGHFGHLGLILSDAWYATLATTVPWISPVNPGPFGEDGTAPQIEAAKDVWRDLKLEFDLCQATEKAHIAGECRKGNGFGGKSTLRTSRSCIVSVK
jgi:hypothetical protein